MAFPCRERDLRVIRPFVYVREKSLRQFAESRDLPVIPENCPACFEAPKVSKEGCDDSMPVGWLRNPHVNSLQAVSKIISTKHPMMTMNKFHVKFTPVFLPNLLQLNHTSLAFCHPLFALNFMCMKWQLILRIWKFITFGLKTKFLPVLGMFWNSVSFYKEMDLCPLHSTRSRLGCACWMTQNAISPPLLLSHTCA